ncbi:MAG: hypothetical protein KGM47_16820, partial [Acidobacteriota bacterium]|nr:hypothetical protein [Acidobacteriota bacterium]
RRRMRTGGAVAAPRAWDHRPDIESGGNLSERAQSINLLTIQAFESERRNEKQGRCLRRLRAA